MLSRYSNRFANFRAESSLGNEDAYAVHAEDMYDGMSGQRKIELVDMLSDFLTTDNSEPHLGLYLQQQVEAQDKSMSNDIQEYFKNMFTQYTQESGWSLTE